MAVQTGGGSAAVKAPAKTPPASPALVAAATGATKTPGQAAASTNLNGQSTLNQYLTYLKTAMGRINPTQIANQAQSEINAQVSPIIAGYQAQQTAGTNAIEGYTNTLAAMLGALAPATAAGYQTAEGQQNAVDQSIQAELAGNGGAQASALTADLAARGQDTSPGTQAGANATGAAGAAYATGAASLSQLLADSASSNAYQTAQPGLAALSGLQAVGALQANIGSAESSAVNTAQGQYPTLVNQLTNQAVDMQKTNLSLANAGLTAANNDTKNTIAQQKNQTAADLEATANSIRQQTANTSATKAQNDAVHQTNQDQTAAYKAQVAKTQGDARLAQGQAKIGIEQQNADTSAYRAAIADYNAHKVKAPKGPSASATRLAQQYEGTANLIAGNARNGFTPSPTSSNPNPAPVEPISYGEALQEMLKGTPSLGAIPYAQAVKSLNAIYPPGVQGRPATAKQVAQNKSAVAKTAKVVGFKAK